ncbi:MAG: 23S rRNA (uracil(1939)-C(5))-methyltransferase RlmD [Bacteroidetes bacterium]|nr:23S rRNA (uracil(1939)-C(5))-methyltransferase RlmD [Rhodothermia bacterium]MCS7155047.1 23S rRNA (uracil(1939)-C(5))-methyltransferase RlmD [Bacteroidota bacterium]MCX7907331.1 23S rRNA (uracil(1939)-C(5))-methyltransferase RlmD [Bacteroidota bacterium]MDW8137942.1 23S rRNA (uracil(1939)-C(5))-methyltransferase RlmD [Bacteroidota bacterium]MDW8286206.1 23S rRNA (uracil(1939)-C(5))-methyltransferase RlmD [Bacteroidota bacterium]
MEREWIVEIEKPAFEGKGLGRIDGRIIFVPRAVPGDRLRVRPVKIKSQYAEAVTLEVLRSSPDRVEAPCRHFGLCGGCSWQHVRYEAQLAYKRELVRELFVYLGNLDGLPEVRPVIGADPIFGYRNKLEFSFSPRRWLSAEEIATGEPLDKGFALGFHLPGRYDRVLHLERCWLAPELGNRLLAAIGQYVRTQGWSVYDPHRQRGYLRHLVLRFGVRTHQVLVNLVTHTDEPERMQALSGWLQETFPEVSTFVNNITSRPAQVAVGEQERVYLGPGYIEEQLGPFRFRIAANTFFQPNTHQAERLYEVVRELAELRPTDRLFDLYCGAGTIGIYLSPWVREVVGIEQVPVAVENARQNALLNGVRNATFYCGDVRQMPWPELMAAHGAPDVVVLDPPRSGLHPDVVRLLLELGPERIVYVSCNPATQARDLKGLITRYRIEAIQPVDLFPHTYHIETVVRLTRQP